MAAVWLSGFGDALTSDPGFVRNVPNRELRAALLVCARGIDSVWIVLAAINTYFVLVRTEGIAVARRWSMSVLLVGFALPALGALSVWPLGAVFYPHNLGLKIGPVPFAVPLLWFVIIVGAREASWRMLPRAGHGAVALGTGVAVFVTAANLEPLASKYRAWWIWSPIHSSNEPYANLASWLLASMALSWMMRTPHVVPQVSRRPFTPVASIVFLNVLAIVTRLVLR